MFYAGIDPKKGDFQNKQGDVSTPVNEKKTASKPTSARPPKVLKDAASKALNYP